MRYNKSNGHDVSENRVRLIPIVTNTYITIKSIKVSGKAAATVETAKP